MTNINRDYVVSKRILNIRGSLEAAVTDLKGYSEFFNLTYREYDGNLYTHTCKVIEITERHFIIKRKPTIDGDNDNTLGLINTVVKSDAIVKLEKINYDSQSTYDRYYTELWSE
ncbi:gp192 [Bacillus phage W.Ph.]|uniref:Gp192 n=1 Tax=Bacillus phage W.Ph. TaxID=764595 RepID=G9B1U3_9CAUD|nr:gp192 [Bacillus phage W.Ph.]ADH03338.1 gp192 [Bacillus phage W.Ph.]